MVDGVEGRFLYTAYIFPVLRTFAVCSAPIVGAGIGGACKCKCPPYMNYWGLWRVLGLSGDFDSGADGDEVVKLDHVGVA
jgi:hypothetical protein